MNRLVGPHPSRTANPASNRRGLGLLLLCLAAALIGCQPAGEQSPGPSGAPTTANAAHAAAIPSANPATGAAAAGAGVAALAPHEEGRRIWNFRCYYCHGYSGDARTLAASFIDPPPRDFRALSPDAISRQTMIAAVSHGRPGSAMVGFAGTLNPREIEWVVDFVREEFMRHKAANTRYHTAENGWPNHERYRIAFPFATGDIAMDKPWDQLDDTQTAGKRLFLNTCVSCHDRALVTAHGSPWEIFGVSYPPGNYVEEHDEPEHHDRDKPVAAAAQGHDKAPADQAIDPYELHENPPRLVGAGAIHRRGEQVFQRNCAHCHAADGTGRNWIGSFLDPHPPDFTKPEVASRLGSSRVTEVTRTGMPGSSMPAWRGVLSAADIRAVAAYVEHAFARPAASRAARQAPSAPAAQGGRPPESRGG